MNALSEAETKRHEAARQDLILSKALWEHGTVTEKLFFHAVTAKLWPIICCLLTTTSIGETTRRFGDDGRKAWLAYDLLCAATHSTWMLKFNEKLPKNTGSIKSQAFVEREISTKRLVIPARDPNNGKSQQELLVIEQLRNAAKIADDRLAKEPPPITHAAPTTVAPKQPRLQYTAGEAAGTGGDSFSTTPGHAGPMSLQQLAEKLKPRERELLQAMLDNRVTTNPKTPDRVLVKPLKDQGYTNSEVHLLSTKLSVARNGQGYRFTQKMLQELGALGFNLDQS